MKKAGVSARFFKSSNVYGGGVDLRRFHKFFRLGVYANSFWAISIGHLFVKKDRQNAVDELRILHLHIFG